MSNATPPSSRAPSPRTTVRRLPRRADYDPQAIRAILAEGRVAHVGLSSGGELAVAPMAYALDGERLLFHGSPSSRLLREMADGAEVCVQVTLLDGLVLARSWFHHSMNYRSVTVYGQPRAITEHREKRLALERIVDFLAPGRVEGSRAPGEREVGATLVVELPVVEASAKVRRGPPSDDEADLDLPFLAGVIPLKVVPGIPVAAPDLKPEVDMPAHVGELGRAPLPRTDHAPRPFRDLGLLEVAPWRLKVTGIASRGDLPDARLVDGARVTVRDCLLRSPELVEPSHVGFVGVHDGEGANFVFLDRWFRTNELHHVVWTSPKEEPAALRRTGEGEASVCVWDLHLQHVEREAWVRHGLAVEGTPDREGYLAQRYAGEA